MRPVERAVTKPERVGLLYPSNGYTGLIQDTLDQLVNQHLVSREDGRWTATEQFLSSLGKPVQVIPRRPTGRSIKVVVHPKGERERLNAAAIDDRELQAIYNDLRNDRAFEVKADGKRRQLRVHPLVLLVPPRDWADFVPLANNLRQNGIHDPLRLFDGQVLDGRHRLAVAAAFRLPVRTEKAPGVEDERGARKYIMSVLSAGRNFGKMNTAARALIVLDLYLAEAEEEVQARLVEGQRQGGEVHVRRGQTAAQRAAVASNGLANARTIERMIPVRDAPKTRAAILNGTISDALAARRSALEETGAGLPPEPPALPRTPYKALGLALYELRRANDALAGGDAGDTLAGDCVARVQELRDTLDETDRLLKAGHRL